MRNYRQLYALLNLTGQSKEDMVAQATEGRTESAKEMTDAEYNLLLSMLAQQEDARVSVLRRVVHRMCLMGYTTEDNKPDYVRINEWMRTRTAAKCDLGKMTHSQMMATGTQVEAVWRSLLKEHRKKTGTPR